MVGESHTTTDHQTIQRWVEERGGRPASVKQTGNHQNAGILRIDFPGYGDDASLEPISWEVFSKNSKRRIWHFSIRMR